MTPPQLSACNFLGLRFDNLTMPEAISKIVEWAAASGARECKQVAFVNAHCFNVASGNAHYREVVCGSDLVLPDGIGVRLAGSSLGQPVRDNVNGTDMFPILCRELERQGCSLALLGAAPGAAEGVANWLRDRHRSLRVSFVRDGFFQPSDEEDLIESLEADVLLVAMGVPRQDLWIAAQRERLKVGVAIGVGGLFDFFSGRVPRAPIWLRRLKLEWAYRLWREPRRMWRRYLVGNVRFLVAVARERWKIHD